MNTSHAFKFAIVFALALTWIFLSYRASYSHVSPKGMVYPTDCCNSNECAPIDPSYVTEDAVNYYLSLPKDSHPWMKAPYTKTFKKMNTVGQWSNRIKFSTDGDHHACCSTTQCYCIIIPPQGF